LESFASTYYIQFNSSSSYKPELINADLNSEPEGISDDDKTENDIKSYAKKKKRL